MKPPLAGSAGWEDTGRRTGLGLGLGWVWVWLGLGLGWVGFGFGFGFGFGLGSGFGDVSQGSRLTANRHAVVDGQVETVRLRTPLRQARN